jgi:hypothetical protein
MDVKPNSAVYLIYLGIASLRAHDPSIAVADRHRDDRRRGPERPSRSGEDPYSGRGDRMTTAVSPDRRAA